MPAKKRRSKVTEGVTYQADTGCGSLYVTVNREGNDFCEVFLTMGRSGGCFQAQAEAVGRLISLALRSGVEMEDIQSQLMGIRCSQVKISDGEESFSCPDAISKVLKKILEKESKEKKP